MKDHKLKRVESNSVPNNNGQDLETDDETLELQIKLDCHGQCVSQWTENDVSLWIRNLLLKDKLDEKEIVQPFLKEFNQQHITGQKIVKFITSPCLIDELRKEFSIPNQAFGIWVVIKCEMAQV